MEEVKEPEKKEAEKKRTAPGTGEQYLLAMIKCADWVPHVYKKLSEKNKANIEVVKELYLCACDSVPAEKAIEALENDSPEGALRVLRLKQLENIARGSYQDELSGIKRTTTSLEQEVKQMSETLSHIAMHVPNFEAMFPDLQPLSKDESSKPTESSVAENVEVQSDQAMNEQIAKQVEETDRLTDTHKENILESGIKKLKDLRAVNPFKKKRISEFMENCLQEGYSQEQLSYFLDCIESGTTLEEIKRFASPKLPVTMMQRLRVMEERKENINGK